MDLSASAFWWVVTGLVVAAELATGTFYLLMIALGTAAAAVASHLGWSGNSQLVTAAVVGCSATGLWHWRRAHAPQPLPAALNRDVNLDIGEHVHVESWSADRTARIAYRGTLWSARLLPGAPAGAGRHAIHAVEGNWLIVVPVPPRDH